jgi:hypothetical protein
VLSLEKESTPNLKHEAAIVKCAFLHRRIAAESAPCLSVYVSMVAGVVNRAGQTATELRQHQTSGAHCIGCIYCLGTLMTSTSLAFSIGTGPEAFLSHFLSYHLVIPAARWNKNTPMNAVTRM